MAWYLNNKNIHYSTDPSTATPENRKFYLDGYGNFHDEHAVLKFPPVASRIPNAFTYQDVCPNQLWPQTPKRLDLPTEISQNLLKYMDFNTQRPIIGDHKCVLFAPQNPVTSKGVIYDITAQDSNNIVITSLNPRDEQTLEKVFNNFAGHDGFLSLDGFHNANNALGISHRLSREDERVVFFSGIKGRFNRSMTWNEFKFAIGFILQNFLNIFLPLTAFSETNRDVLEYKAIFIPSQKYDSQR